MGIKPTSLTFILYITILYYGSRTLTFFTMVLSINCLLKGGFLLKTFIF